MTKKTKVILLEDNPSHHKVIQSVISRHADVFPFLKDGEEDKEDSNYRVLIDSIEAYFDDPSTVDEYFRKEVFTKGDYDNVLLVIDIFLKANAEEINGFKFYEEFISLYTEVSESYILFFSGEHKYVVQNDIITKCNKNEKLTYEPKVISKRDKDGKKKSRIDKEEGLLSFVKKYGTELMEMEMPDPILPVVVILTAIKEEYLAVRIHLSNINDANQKGTSYESGIYSFGNKQIANVIIRECGAKNPYSSQETERAIQHFTPDIILFVGIAGSRKPNDFSICDVIFPEKIYYYEGGKSERDSTKARPDIAKPTYQLLELFKRERLKDDWKILIKSEIKAEVTGDTGIIASGEQVVEHYNSEVGEILTEHYNDASVTDMESFGFANAAQRQGMDYSNMKIGVIRGISDIIERDEVDQDTEEHDRRPSNLKKLASDTASAFAFWLIYKTYE